MGNVEKLYEYVKGIIVNYRVKSCCCIAPLRVGIIFIAYFNVAVSLVLIVGTATQSFVTMSVRVQELVAEEATVSTCILAPVVDFAANVLLVCAIHRKDLVLLRVYCCYGMASIAACFLVYSLVIPVIEALYMIVIVISLVYQVYVLILVRSVMVEIRLEQTTKNELIYNKRDETVLIKDVEKHDTEVAQTEDIATPELQVVNETNVEPTESISKSNTLKVDAQVNTEPSWRTGYYINRPLVIPKVDTVVSVLASTSKDTNINKSELGLNTNTDVNKDGEVIENAINKEDTIQTEVEEKTDTKPCEVKEAPQKKKRGIFRRTPKEEKSKDKKKDDTS